MIAVLLRSEACSSRLMLHQQAQHCVMRHMPNQRSGIVISTKHRPHLYFADDVVINALCYIFPQSGVIFDKERNTSGVSKSLALCFAGDIDLYTDELRHCPILCLNGGHGQQIPERSAILPVVQKPDRACIAILDSFSQCYNFFWVCAFPLQEATATTKI